MTTAGFVFPPFKGEKAGNTLPERTGQMSYQPASGRAPAARDSNPCRWEGGKEENTVSSRQSMSVGGKGWLLAGWGCVGREAMGPGYSRLGGVHGRGGVADVLRALEDAEGQAGQEVPR